jgi:hypothetical protein
MIMDTFKQHIGDGIALITRHHENERSRKISGVLLAIEDDFIKIKARCNKPDSSDDDKKHEHTEEENYILVSEIGQFKFIPAEAALEDRFFNLGVW